MVVFKSMYLPGKLPLPKNAVIIKITLKTIAICISMSTNAIKHQKIYRMGYNILKNNKIFVSQTA